MDLTFSFKKLCDIARKYNHKDGWRIAWLENDELKLKKGKEPLWESECARSVIQDIKSGANYNSVGWGI